MSLSSLLLQTTFCLQSLSRAAATAARAPAGTWLRGSNEKSPSAGLRWTTPSVEATLRIAFSCERGDIGHLFASEPAWKLCSCGPSGQWATYRSSHRVLQPLHKNNSCGSFVEAPKTPLLLWRRELLPQHSS